MKDWVGSEIGLTVERFRCGWVLSKNQRKSIWLKGRDAFLWC